MKHAPGLILALALTVMRGASASAQAPPAEPPQNVPPPAPSPATPEPPPPAAAVPPAVPPAGSVTGATTLPTITVEEQAAKPPPARAPRRPTSARAGEPQGEPAAASQPQQPATTPADMTEATAGSAVAGQPSAGALVRTSPLAGSEIAVAKIAGAVTIVPSTELARAPAATVGDVLQSSVPGLVIADVQGNAFQADVQFRGFTSSPVVGTPQGLAVYQNGVRINEVWGDTVNWDVLPAAAISSVSVASNNPVFGLNAIGGSIAVTMKNGFDYHGGEVGALAGSFGRRQISVQQGASIGGIAGYVALEGVHDDGFRDFSSSNLRRMYASVGAKGERGEINIEFTGASNSYGVAAATPVELLAKSWGQTFTTPQTTSNTVEMLSSNGSLALGNTLKLSGLAYVRHFNQRHTDGNIGGFEDCGGVLCLEGETLNGGGIATPAAPTGTIDRTTTDALGYGAAVQAVESSRLLGLGNRLLAGVSLDRGSVGYRSSSELGLIGPGFVVTGTGTGITSPSDLAPRSLSATTTYTGLYVSDTLDVTDRLSVSAGGRLNVAQLDLADRTGAFPDLTGSHTFTRFNPMLGATLKLAPGVTLYGGYSEANRAPTPVELACSNPAQPCIIDTFLTSDPPLKQVVSHTLEAGLRGEGETGAVQQLVWSLGLFRTLNTSDILAVASPLTGRGTFANAGDTLRQGIEASIGWSNETLTLWAAYSLVDATFRSPLELASPNNPSAGPCSADPTQSCVDVRPGDRLPGIPMHRLKAGVDYRVTRDWKVGGDLIVVGDQVLRGDESNLNARLGGYTRVDLKTTYDVTTGVQVFGSVQNLFDRRYATSGTYFNVAAANAASGATGVVLSDSRTITPAQPLAAYAGVRVKF